MHGAFIVGPGAGRDPLAVAFARLVLPTQPIHCAIAGEARKGFAAPCLRPFIKQGIERLCAAAEDVDSTSYRIIVAERLVRDSTPEFSISGRDVEIERSGTASERLCNDIAG